MRREYSKAADARILIDKIRRHFERKGYDSKLVSDNIISIENISAPRKLAGPVTSFVLDKLRGRTP
ncbi:MAG TPA: hypothetical protein VGC09_19560 [Rhodopila sp.]